MSYDRTIKMYDEPHPPVTLDKVVQSGTINQGKFATEAYGHSYLLQLATIRSLSGVRKVFEVGPGEAFVARNLATLGYTYHTFDFEDAHNPTFVGDLRTLDVSTIPERYDLTCAFQVLEHFPYDEFITHVKRLAALSKRYVFLSLPYSCRGFTLSLRVQNGQHDRTNRQLAWYWETNLPNRKYRPEYMAEFPWAVHYWEIGRSGFKLKTVVQDIESCGLKVTRKFHSPNAYHLFFLAEKATK